MSRAKDKRQRERARRQRKEQRRIEHPEAVVQAAPSARSVADPICGVASPTIDASLSWYVARTMPRMGERALEALQAAKVVTYQPRASEVVVRRGRRVVRHTPMLIRTVFIGVVDGDHLNEAKAAPGVAELVCYPAQDMSTQGNIAGPVMEPARLDAVGLQRFVDAIAKGEIAEPLGIKAGDGVVVTNGPFASFPAVVEEILPGDRLRVAVSIFGRASPVELGLADVQTS